MTGNLYNTLPPPAVEAKSLKYELFGEVLGMAVLIILGDGTSAVSGVMGVMSFYLWLFIVAGWALAVFTAVLISGGHLNSAVTISEMVNDGLPLRKGFCFLVAQLLGAFLGALILTFIYIAIQGNNHLRNFYCTQKLPLVPYITMIFYEFVCTGFLVLIPKLVMRHRSLPLGRFQTSSLMALVIVFLGLVAWWIKTFALNPARDLGPRLCWLFFEIGFGSGNLWNNVMGGGYFVIPIMAPLMGGVSGGLLFKKLFSEHVARGDEADLSKLNIKA